MTRVLSLSEALSGAGLEAVRALRARGGVLGIPTDTLYGLAADPLSAAGCAAVYEMKGRPAGKAMPVLVAAVGQLGALGVTADPALLERLSRLWPAPLTVVLPLASGIPASAGAPTLAVRIPAHAALRELLRAAGPLTATSANPSGSPPAASAAEVERYFPGLDLVLDGGPSTESRPSTLVDATGTPPRLLREGSFPYPGTS